MERKILFMLLTIVIVLTLTLQLTDAFDGINNAINSSLSWNDPLVGLFTDTASLALTALYIILFFLWDFKDRGRLSRFTLELTVTVVVSMALVALLKILVGVPRPGEAQVHWSLIESIKNLDYFAFPSGHTARAFVLAYFLAKRWKKFWPLWWGWALGIGLSRLFLHAHWFSDVLFSAFLGPWVALLVELTEDWWLPYYRAIVNALKLGVLDVE
ncbi:phosphatase PAP2 family protein [Thermococcus sp.]|uniref:phosphatase PAP2 family protein n=1 Tax=Thermococcus sp. TaxID=35749 RepID=UPI002632C67B|nr:phosphatase PAP2 family protein [Thermococcus sp.]